MSAAESELKENPKRTKHSAASSISPSWNRFWAYERTNRTQSKVCVHKEYVHTNLSHALHLKTFGKSSPKGVRGKGVRATVPEIFEQGLCE